MEPSAVANLDASGFALMGLEANFRTRSWGLFDGGLVADRTDIAVAGSRLFDFRSGPFVTRSGGGSSSSLVVANFIGFFVDVGSYPVAGGFRSPSRRTAQNNRIWIVNNDGRLFYGD